MSSKCTKQMADLNFLLVPSFLRYVEVEAELKEVSTHAIFSFSVGKYGLVPLLKRKQKLLEDLRGNNKKLSVWSAATNYAHESKEMVIIRSLYMTTRTSIQMVKGHVETANALLDTIKSEDPRGLGIEELTYDEFPF